MTVFISHTTIDAHRPFELSEWWKATLGYVDIPDDPNEPHHDQCMIIDPQNGHQILFIKVPDLELPAKRIHFDVRPRERTQHDEAEWLVGRGATLVSDMRGKYGPGTGWVTLADPEGNLFCVLRSSAELDDLGD